MIIINLKYLKNYIRLSIKKNECNTDLLNYIVVLLVKLAPMKI